MNPDETGEDRGAVPVSRRTLTTLRRLASMKGYAPPRDNLTEAEARDAITWLTRLKRGEDGRAVRLPAVADPAAPNTTLLDWRLPRP
jgi:hypothetical protein